MEVEHEVDDGSLQPCAQSLVYREPCAGQLAGSFKVEYVEGFADVPVSLCFETEFARLTDSADLHIVRVVVAFLDVLVRNVRDAEQHVPEFFFDLSDLAVEFLDAVREFLHLLEESGYVLALFLQLRHLAGRNVLLVLERLHFRKDLTPPDIKFLYAVDTEIAFSASFNSGFYAVKIFPNTFDIQHCSASFL